MEVWTVLAQLRVTIIIMKFLIIELLTFKILYFGEFPEDLPEDALYNL